MTENLTWSPGENSVLGINFPISITSPEKSIPGMKGNSDMPPKSLP